MNKRFDDAAIARILADVAGIGAERAAKKHGVSPRQIYRWKQAFRSTKATAPKPNKDLEFMLAAQQQRLMVALKHEAESGKPNPQTQVIAREVERLTADLAEAKQSHAPVEPARSGGEGGDPWEDVRTLIGVGVRHATELLRSERDPEKVTRCVERMGNMLIVYDNLRDDQRGSTDLEDREPAAPEGADSGSAASSGDSGGAKPED